MTIPDARGLRPGADHGPSLGAAEVTLVTAMENEARPLRRLLPHVPLVRAGIALCDLRTPPATPVVLSIGLAGGLDPELHSGTVVVPREIAREDGVLLACDPTWSAALESASLRLGFPTVTLPLLSADAIVTHAARGEWFARGFAAVDMETALLAALVPRVAAVRVVIDTPAHEISPAWSNPRRAARDPRNWGEVLWLMRRAPRFTLRAAQVVAAALQQV